MLFILSLLHPSMYTTNVFFFYEDCLLDQESVYFIFVQVPHKKIIKIPISRELPLKSQNTLLNVKVL